MVQADIRNYAKKINPDHQSVIDRALKLIESCRKP
jgi:hypothetical protein